MMTQPCFFFFFNDTATTEIYTLSLHDALPISKQLGLRGPHGDPRQLGDFGVPISLDIVQHEDFTRPGRQRRDRPRSEEHTSELQSQSNLVCRLLLGKKKISRSTALIIRFGELV